MRSEKLTLDLMDGGKISGEWIHGSCTLCSEERRCLMLRSILVGLQVTLTSPLKLCENCLIFVDAARKLDPGTTNAPETAPPTIEPPTIDEAGAP